MFHFHGLRFGQEEGTGPNVNQTAGFTEALALAAGHELTDEERAALSDVQDRDISSGLTQESQTPDPVGQEAPAPVAEPPVEGAAPPAEQEPGTEQDPQFEEGYLKALGEQSEKLGAATARADALEARLAALEEGPGEEEDQGIYFPDSETMDRLVERFDEQGGQALMGYVANAEPDNIPAAMALWKAGGDPDVAAAYLYEEHVNRLVNEGQQSAQPVAAELPASLQALAQREEMATVFGGFAAELGQDKAAALAPHVDAAVAAAGPLTQKAIADAVASGDPAQQKSAFDEVVALAEARAATAHPAPVVEKQQQVRQEAKRAAQVNLGSRRSVSPGQSAAGGDLPASKAEFEQLDPEAKRIAATKLVADQFEKTDTTSVRDGLTFGSKP